MKLVVRRNELACRDSWSSDLFAPRGSEGASADIVLHDNIAAPPAPRARAEEVTFFVNGHHDRSASSGSSDHAVSPKPVDVVVGQMPSSNPAADRAPLLNHDNRSAILKARERHRARKGSTQRHVEPILLTSNVVDDIDVVSPAYQRSDDRTPIAPYSPRPRRADEVPPVQRNEIPRDFPTMTSFPEDDERFMTVPEPVTGIDLPRRSGSAPSAPQRNTDHGFRDDTIVDQGLTSYATTPRLEVPPHASNASSFAEVDVVDDRRSQPSVDADDESELYAAEYDESDDYEPIDEVIPIFRPERRRFDFGWRRPARVQQQPMAMEEMDVEPEVWIEEPPPVAVEDHQILAEFEPYLDLEEDVVIAPDVPRMCRTCRDFRPADSGDRGWCTNQWAFSHRRMVDPDELPCETSVGMWWLPSDEVWLATADLSAHSQPTPLVDLWLAKTRQEDTESSGERRRKRS